MTDKSKAGKGLRLQSVRSLYLILEVLFLTLLVLAFLPSSPLPSWLTFLLLVADLTGMTRLDYGYWRCPVCGEHLGKSFFSYPKTCPSCGHPIDLKERVDAKALADQAKREDAERLAAADARVRAADLRAANQAEADSVEGDRGSPVGPKAPAGLGSEVPEKSAKSPENKTQK